MTDFCLQRNPPTCVTSTERPTTENWDALKSEPEAVTVSVVTPIPDTFATTVAEVPGWAGNATTLPHTGVGIEYTLVMGVLFIVLGLCCRSLERKRRKKELT